MKLTAKHQKYILNGLLVLIIAFIELGILFLNSEIFFGKLNGSIYVKVAAIILLAWLGLMLGFYAWAIYFYNVNFGMTNEDWEKIKKHQEEAMQLKAMDIEPPSLHLNHPVENPYKDETFGLPPGTVRATIAITVLVAGISMLFVSFDPEAIKTFSANQAYLEYFKTAFLMMIAFYFGSQSLKYLKPTSKDDEDAPETPTEPAPSKQIPSDVVKEDVPQSQAPTSISKPVSTGSRLVDKKSSLQLSNKRISREDVQECATQNSLEPALIYTVLSVESSGKGFGADGRPIILFEGHVFYRLLKNKGIDPAPYALQHPDIVYMKWTKKYYSGTQSGEYARMEKAMLIDKETAWQAASWGLFQILGENFKAAGFTSIEDFVKAHELSEKEQLNAFIAFIKSQNLLGYLKAYQWRDFARRYNGPGYEANQYHIKLEEAYAKQLKKLEPAIQVKILRTERNDVETLGTLEVKNADRTVFTCKTLELPWKNNERNISCIPPGTYKVAKRYSESFQYHFHVQDVPGRNWILIHSGNFYSDIRGCILVGFKHIDLNGDGVLDISNSKETLQKMLKILPDTFTLTIA
ncbi:MAG: DUF5675 family protein [Cytophagaceae bacterium]|jgi:hypothetical protein|nr:DUF5675 family protein [Cytophagaceae bacterium]